MPIYISFLVALLILVCSTALFAQAAQEESKTITMWVSASGAQVDALKAAVEAFEAETGYTVELSAPEALDVLSSTKKKATSARIYEDSH